MDRWKTPRPSDHRAAALSAASTTSPPQLPVWDVLLDEIWSFRDARSLGWIYALDTAVTAMIEIEPPSGATPSAPGR